MNVKSKFLEYNNFLFHEFGRIGLNLKLMKLKMYTLLKSFGFFKLSKFLFRDKVLILAYHGFELYNESSFSDKLFIKPSTLDRRMNFLAENNFTVISLKRALTCLTNKESLPNNSVVITIDDGWYSTIAKADKIFSRHFFPYTIYITSYYVEKETPVLNVVLRYLLWSYSEDLIDINLLKIQGIEGVYSPLHKEQRKEAHHKLFLYFEDLEDDEKIEFLRKISDLVGVDYDKIETDRYLNHLNLSEIKKLAEKGVDIQLHTHTHTGPTKQKDNFDNEIFENKNCLMSCVKDELEHFCYPSGIYDMTCEEILKRIGITSASTCDPGFVSYNTNHYYLPRFLDGENISQIAFEAELSGTAEIFRYVRKIIRRIGFKSA